MLSLHYGYTQHSAWTVCHPASHDRYVPGVDTGQPGQLAYSIGTGRKLSSTTRQEQSIKSNLAFAFNNNDNTSASNQRAAASVLCCRHWECPKGLVKSAVCWLTCSHPVRFSCVQCVDAKFPQKKKKTALGTGKGHRGLPIVRLRGTLSMSEVNRVNRGKGEYTERDRQGGRMSLERWETKKRGKRRFVNYTQRWGCYPGSLRCERNGETAVAL